MTIKGVEGNWVCDACGDTLGPAHTSFPINHKCSKKDLSLTSVQELTEAIRLTNECLCELLLTLKK